MYVSLRRIRKLRVLWRRVIDVELILNALERVSVVGMYGKKGRKSDYGSVVKAVVTRVMEKMRMTIDEGIRTSRGCWIMSEWYQVRTGICVLKLDSENDKPCDGIFAKDLNISSSAQHTLLINRLNHQ